MQQGREVLRQFGAQRVGMPLSLAMTVQRNISTERDNALLMP